VPDGTVSSAGRGFGVASYILEIRRDTEFPPFLKFGATPYFFSFLKFDATSNFFFEPTPGPLRNAAGDVLNQFTLQGARRSLS
jgi:hypothetical protein